MIIGFIIYSPKIIIEHYDNVEIDYTVWASDEDKNYDLLNPILDTILWVKMVPITENVSSGIILGLYNNLAGKSKSYQSGFIWLNRCIDEDRNGIDDNTGDPALSYGHSADLYFDTCLMIQFQILNIEKSLDSPQFTDIEQFILKFVGIVGITIGVGMVGLITGYYINKYKKYRKAKPKTMKERHYALTDLLIKYGILIGLLIVVTIIILAVVNLYFPLPFIFQYTPEAVWIIIVLILTIWAICIPLYLIIYKMLEKKIQKE
ncbi:MAG: hypothetical protein ACFFDF_03995 [Candidatus Odinarchaeota archaeon]